MNDLMITLKEFKQGLKPNGYIAFKRIRGGRPTKKSYVCLDYDKKSKKYLVQGYDKKYLLEEIWLKPTTKVIVDFDI